MREDEKDFLEESFRKEVLKSMDEKLSAKQKEALREEASVTVDFLNKIDEIELPKDNYIVFTDGKEQLLYENGDFYVVSTTDSLKKKKKKTKKEATDMYLDFFIKYQLNPILDSKNMSKDKSEPRKEKIELAEKEVQREPEVKQKIERSEPSL